MSLTIGFLKGWYEIYQIYIKREEKQKFWHEALVRQPMFYFEKHFY